MPPAEYPVHLLRYAPGRRGRIPRASGRAHAEERIRRARRAYYALVTSLDERIGLLLAELKLLGLEDDTIVVYTTDHGQSVGEHGLWFHNEPTDCSSRVPLIMAGPGIPTGKCVDAPVMHVDLFPTFMDLAGATVPAGLRGSSLVPLLEGLAPAIGRTSPTASATRKGRPAARSSSAAGLGNTFTTPTTTTCCSIWKKTQVNIAT